jgi:hypothetical protein
VKINETIPRIRAAISAVQVRAAAAVPVMVAAVQVPYIVYNYVLGVFVKFLTRTDRVTIASDTELSMTKPFADQYTAADFPDVVPNKRLPDGVEAADALSPFQIGKGLFENPKVEEGPYFAEDYTDPGYTIVSFQLAFTKARVETVTATDADFALDMTLAPTDGVSMVDNIVFTRILSIIDAATAADSGSIRMQDYCSPDYFAEDYVGEVRNF